MVIIAPSHKPELETGTSPPESALPVLLAVGSLSPTYCSLRPG